MLAVLVTGPTATQNSPFLPQRCPKPSVVVNAWPKVGPSGLENTRMIDQLKVIANPSTDRDSQL